jgi:hypothetical protein
LESDRLGTDFPSVFDRFPVDSRVLENLTPKCEVSKKALYFLSFRILSKSSMSNVTPTINKIISFSIPASLLPCVWYPPHHHPTHSSSQMPLIPPQHSSRPSSYSVTSVSTLEGYTVHTFFAFTDSDSHPPSSPTRSIRRLRPRS